jgi:hypothetical protein
MSCHPEPILSLLNLSKRNLQEITNGRIPRLTIITSSKVKGLSDEVAMVSKIRAPAMIVAFACNRSLAVIV